MNIYKCSGETKENNNTKMLLRTIKNVMIRRCLSTTKNTNFNNNLLKTVVLSNGSPNMNLKLEKAVLSNISSVNHQEEFCDDAIDAHAIISWRVPELRKVELEQLENCVVISRVGVGVDSVDIKLAGELGIRVNNIPAYGTEEVADHTMVHILNLYRKFSIAIKNVENNVQTTTANATTQQLCKGARRIRGEKLGIIGFGRIGMAVARKAAAFGFHVGFYDPYVGDGMCKSQGVDRYEELDDLLANSDCISLHCTHTDETHFILNDNNLKNKVKDDVFIVNTARGGLIDDFALGEQVRAGKIAGAGIDCQTSEPAIFHSLSNDGPFQDCGDQLVVTPHSAFFSEPSILDMKTMSANEAAIVLNTKTDDIRNAYYRNCVNEQYLNYDAWYERMERL